LGNTFAISLSVEAGGKPNPRKMLGLALRAPHANVPQPNLRIKAFFLKGEGIA
jgi:hypothetical protein